MKKFLSYTEENDLNDLKLAMKRYIKDKDIKSLYRAYLEYSDLLTIIAKESDLNTFLTDNEIQYMRENKPIHYKNLAF